MFISLNIKAEVKVFDSSFEEDTVGVIDNYTSLLKWDIRTKNNPVFEAFIDDSQAVDGNNSIKINTISLGVPDDRWNITLIQNEFNNMSLSAGDVVLIKFYAKASENGKSIGFKFSNAEDAVKKGSFIFTPNFLQYSTSININQSGEFYNFRFFFAETTGTFWIDMFEVYIISPPEPDGRKNYYISNLGNDLGSGSISDPFASITHAVSVMGAGDSCIIREGRYSETVSLAGLNGSYHEPIVFSSYPGEKVVLDGSIEVAGNWEYSENGIYKTYFDEDIWQLWVDSIPGTLARFPNSIVWSEEFWDQTKSWSVASGYNGYTNDPELSQFDFSLDGCVMVINSGNWKTRAALVRNHLPGSSEFYFDPLPEDSFNDKPLHPYFLTGRQLLDSPGEWFYDSTVDSLFLIPEDGIAPSSKTIRAKNQSYFFDSHGTASHIQLHGFTFFGTTINLNNCLGAVIENCDFLYPASSKRSLLSTVDALHTNLIECDSLLVKNSTFQYSDGKSLTCTGATNPVLENNLFYMIDYAVLAPGSNSYTIHFDKNLSPVARRNTIQYAGAAEGLRIAGAKGEGILIEYNLHTRTGLMQTDGASIQIPPGSGPNDAIIRYNWFINMRRMGARFDGDPAGEYGNIYRSVSAHGSHKGFRLKGDNHEFYHLTAFDAFGGDDLNVAKEKGPGPNGESNMHSIIHNSAAQNVDLSDNFIPTADKTNNWDGVRDNTTTLSSMLNDPLNMDFRPKWDSKLVDAGKEITGVDLMSGEIVEDPGLTNYFGSAPDIGAYEYGDTVYWIPGRKLDKASSAIPASDSSTHSEWVDLMWLEGLNCSSSNVYFGTNETSVKAATENSPEYAGRFYNNIFHPDTLKSVVKYFWRVDNVTEKGNIVKGDVWNFTSTYDANPLLYETEFLVTGRDGELNFPLYEANIFIAGRNLLSNSLGLANIMLQEGNYKYSITKPGFSEISDSFDLAEEGHSILDTLDLEKYRIGFFLIDLKSSDGIESGSFSFNDIEKDLNDSSYVFFEDIIYGNYSYSTLIEAYSNIIDENILIHKDTIYSISLEQNLYSFQLNVSELETEKPMSGVGVNIYDEEHITDINGHAEFSLPLGTHLMSLSKTDYRSIDTMVNIPDEMNISLVMEKISATLKVQLKRNTTPVNNAVVKVGNDSLITNSLGMVTFYELTLNMIYDISAYRDDYNQVSFPFEHLKDTTIIIQMVKLGFADHNDINHVMIYPNPVNDKLNIETKWSKFDARITDANGSLLMLKSIHENIYEMDISFLAPGIYILHLNTKQDHQTFKIIKTLY